MNDSEKLKIKCRKNELINTLDSGMVEEPMQQYALVDAFALDIFLLYDGPERVHLENYITKQNDIKQKIKVEGDAKSKIDERIVNLMKSYADNAKDMYNEIKKL